MKVEVCIKNAIGLEWKTKALLDRILDEMGAKKETIEHEKATFVEALYGVIYLEFGFEELLRTVTFIQ
ncbi:MAG: hypothetical protein ACFFCS_29400 [Candidatus Hodarchaeota archaeon]